MIRRRLESLLMGFELRSTGKWFLLSTLVGVVAGIGAIGFQKLTHLVVQNTLIPYAHYQPGEAKGESIAKHNAATNKPDELTSGRGDAIEKQDATDAKEETSTTQGRIASAQENGAAAQQADSDSFFPWMIVAIMTAGGLLSGFLVYTFAPAAEGHGTDAAIDAFHNHRGLIRARIPIIKTLASAITLGTGGSGGREGPIAQIGAGFGSFLATQLGLSTRDRRIMLAAGIAAGVGAIFRAPLAGALFAGEILYKDGDLESDVIIPAAISSIISYSVYTLSLPAVSRFTPLFGSPPDLPHGTVWDLIPFALLAIVLVLVGILYIKVFYGVHYLFAKLPVKKHFRPAIGACLAGLVAMALYFGFKQNEDLLAVLSTGYGVLQSALTNASSIAPKILIVVALMKIVTTSLTISSGGSGGVFGPSMVIGGCIGAATGQLFAHYGPGWWTDQPEAYAIVGMAGFFAGIAHAPFSTIIMVSEMTGSYNLLLPTMWVSTLCFLLCRKWTLYIKQVPSRLESAAHRGDFIIDLLEGILVEDVYQKDRQLLYVHESMSLEDIVHLLAESDQHYFPVVDNDQNLLGIFSANDVRSYLYDETIWRLANARDVMVTNLVTLSPDDDLNTAMQRFTSRNLDELPVLDPENSKKLLGMLRRKETIAAYNQRMVEIKQQMADE